MSSINTWKKFYHHLCPKWKRSDFLKEVHRKLFSLAANCCKGNFVIEEKDDHLIFIAHRNGCKIYFRFRILGENSNYSAIPKKILPYQVEFIDYTWKAAWHYRYEWMKLRGEYFRSYVDDIISVVDSTPNIEGLYRSRIDALANAMKTYPNKWVKLSNNFVYRDLYLCLEEFFPDIKRGDVFESRADYHIRQSFKSAYENRYIDFQRYTVNLSGEVPVPTKELNCAKQTYGCQYMCTHSCLADSVWKKNKELYKDFITWKNKLI